MTYPSREPEERRAADADQYLGNLVRIDERSLEAPVADRVVSSGNRPSVAATLSFEAFVSE